MFLDNQLLHLLGAILCLSKNSSADTSLFILSTSSWGSELPKLSKKSTSFSEIATIPNPDGLYLFTISLYHFGSSVILITSSKKAPSTPEKLISETKGALLPKGGTTLIQ